MTFWTFVADAKLVVWVIKETLTLVRHVAISLQIEWLDPSGTLLTYDERVLTQDQRFSLQHPYLKEWVLDISNVRNTDAGNYTCRIGPVPVISKYVELDVTSGYFIYFLFIHKIYKVLLQDDFHSDFGLNQIVHNKVHWKPVACRGGHPRGQFS